MNPVAWLPAVVAVVAAVVAVAVVVGLMRRAADRIGARTVQAQAESLRWVSAQLAQASDRAEARVDALGRQLVQNQEATRESLQRQLAERLDAVSRSVGEQLSVSQQSLGEGLMSAAEVFGRVEGGLARVATLAERLEQLGRGIEEIGGILRVPKLRGLLGEQTLEAMLGQVLPPALWTPQHRFADGRTVDAAVTLGDRVLPVDAKFPLESFRRVAAAADDGEREAARRELARAVRGRIDEIAARYLRPDEGTTDFALMFVPAEGVYAEVVGGLTVGDESLLEYALRRRVLPASPSTLYAYLSLVAAGQRGLEVEARAREIVGTLDAAAGQIRRAREELAVLGRHIHNAAQRQIELDRCLVALERQLGGLSAGDAAAHERADPDDG